jgi:hypothetical protein
MNSVHSNSPGRNHMGWHGGGKSKCRDDIPPKPRPTRVNKRGKLEILHPTKGWKPA